MKLKARIEGRPEPTELPPDALSLQQRGSNASVSGESALEREKRIRREAEERMRQKFGSGGIASNAIGSHPMPSGINNDGINTEDLKKKADEAIGALSNTFSYLGTTASQRFSEVQTEDISSKAAETWSSFTTGASSFWNSAISATGGGGEVDFKSLREKSKENETEEERKERLEAEERLRKKFGSQGLKYASVSSRNEFSNSNRSPEEQAEIDRQLKEREEAKERMRKKFGAGGLKGNSVSSSTYHQSSNDSFSSFDTSNNDIISSTAQYDNSGDNKEKQNISRPSSSNSAPAIEAKSLKLGGVPSVIKTRTPPPPASLRQTHRSKASPKAVKKPAPNPDDFFGDWDI